MKNAFKTNTEVSTLENVISPRCVCAADFCNAQGTLPQAWQTFNGRIN